MPRLPPRSFEVPKVPVRKGVTVTVFGSATDRASATDCADAAVAALRTVMITLNAVKTRPRNRIDRSSVRQGGTLTEHDAGCWQSRRGSAFRRRVVQNS